MMKRMKQLAMILLVALLGACSSMPPVKTLQDSWIVSNTALTAINTVTEASLRSKLISSATAKSVLAKTISGGRLLDEALYLKTKGELTLSAIRLSDAKTALIEAKTILTALGVDVSNITL